MRSSRQCWGTAPSRARCTNRPDSSCAAFGVGASKMASREASTTSSPLPAGDLVSGARGLGLGCRGLDLVLRVEGSRLGGMLLQVQACGGWCRCLWSGVRLAAMVNCGCLRVLRAAEPGVTVWAAQTMAQHLSAHNACNYKDAATVQGCHAGMPGRARMCRIYCFRLGEWTLLAGGCCTAGDHTVSQLLHAGGGFPAVQGAAELGQQAFDGLALALLVQLLHRRPAPMPSIVVAVGLCSSSLDKASTVSHLERVSVAQQVSTGYTDSGKQYFDNSVPK